MKFCGTFLASRDKVSGIFLEAFFSIVWLFQGIPLNRLVAESEVAIIANK